jgi:hypothetical protein
MPTLCTSCKTSICCNCCNCAPPDKRWLTPQEAVAWLLCKLDAAEALWSASGGPPHVDYSLVMDGEEDEAFFMTDYAQE